jgi:hypothetical protein
VLGGCSQRPVAASRKEFQKLGVVAFRGGRQQGNAGSGRTAAPPPQGYAPHLGAVSTVRVRPSEPSLA